MVNKRGISAIVATVLIILVTFVGVTIIWLVILPLVQDSAIAVEEDVSLSIIIVQGYTVFDVENQIAAVQVKRGADNTNLTGLNVIFDINGTSKTFKTRSAPEVNGEKTYWFNFSNYSDLEGKVPSGVSVVPIYLKNGVEVLGKVLSNVQMPTRRILLNPEELAAVFSGPNVGVPKYPISGGGGVISYVAVDSCRDLDKPNTVYVLNKSINYTKRACSLSQCLAGPEDCPPPVCPFSEYSCFVVLADNVTLNFNNYNLAYYPSSYPDFEYEFPTSQYFSVGVYNPGYRDFTLKNASVKRFYMGISVNNSRVIGGLYDSNYIGISLSDNNDVSGIKTRANRDSGIMVRGDGNSITNLASFSNANYGILSFGSNMVVDGATFDSDLLGIVFDYLSNNNIIKNSEFITEYPLYLASSSNNNFINITTTGAVILSDDSINNTFLNATFGLPETVEAGAQLIRKWYYRAYVSNMVGVPIPGANVTAYNRIGAYQFDLITDSSGYTPITTIIDYVNNGGVKNYYSPYTMLGQKVSYPDAPMQYNVTLERNNLAHNIDLFLPL